MTEATQQALIGLRDFSTLKWYTTLLQIRGHTNFRKYLSCHLIYIGPPGP